MANIERTDNQYNTTCDTYGCSNIAKHVLGKVGESQAQKHLLCDECYQGYIDAAPIEMIKNRSDLSDIINLNQIFIPEDSNGRLCIESVKCEDVDKNICLDELKYQQLKDIAIKKGITVPFGTSKEELLEMIKE